MSAQKTITINGRQYDAVTGLPVEATEKAAPAPVKAPVAANAAAPKAPVKPVAKATPASRTTNTATTVHGNVEKSKTLMRRAAKKPVAPTKIVRRSQPGRHMDIARSTDVAKFAPHPVVKPAAPAATGAKPTGKVVADAPARVHPSAHRALAKAHAKKPAAVAPKKQTVKEVKDAAIQKALATPKPKSKKQAKNKLTKRLTIAAICIGIVLVAAFAAYRFIPTISVGLASMQAGIDAKYPDYTPDGYALKQPVSYSDGEVNLTFKSNSNDTSYTVNQKRSTWDSSAVLDNVVIPAVGENYTTTKERGLTIYTYDKGAAWVNAGILYTINGAAQLSGDQVRRIATSL